MNWEARLATIFIALVIVTLGVFGVLFFLAAKEPSISYRHPTWKQESKIPAKVVAVHVYHDSFMMANRCLVIVDADSGRKQVYTGIDKVPVIGDNVYIITENNDKRTRTRIENE